VKFPVRDGVGVFRCPGCGCGHRVPVKQSYGGALAWAWNGSENLPTLEPSLVYNFMDPGSRCHSLVRDGRIEFLQDSHHALAGQIVSLPDWEG
jgi:hypothetical protein